MTHNNQISRRTAITALTTSLTGLAGCLDTITPGDASNDRQENDSDEPIATEMADGGRLRVTLADYLEVGQVNLIQPNGELYAKRDVAAGVSQVTFELGTSYQPGDYTILALTDDTTTAKTTHTIEPDLEIVDVGLYRNHPNKPWDNIYGESETDRIKNGEAFVTVENLGTGPDSAIELTFTGDVPNPLENPRGSGIYEREEMSLPAGDTVDLFSSSFPFGSESDDGMGCSPEGNSGTFIVNIRTKVESEQISKTFAVSYRGASEMSDCTVEISEN